MAETPITPAEVKQALLSAIAIQAKNAEESGLKTASESLEHLANAYAQVIQPNRPGKQTS